MSVNWLGIVTMVVLLLFMIKGFRKGFVQEIAVFFFSVITFIMVTAVNPYVYEFLQDSTQVYEKIQGGFEEYIGNKLPEINGAEMQKEILDSMKIPSVLQREIMKENTAAKYTELKVKTYKEYLITYMTNLVMSCISFVLTYILIKILIKMTLALLNLIMSFPILKQTNKIAGALIGILEGMLVIWMAMLLITIMCNTTVGRNVLDLIKSDGFLSFIYDNNILLKIVMNIL